MNASRLSDAYRIMRIRETATGLIEAITRAFSPRLAGDPARKEASELTSWFARWASE